MTCAHQEPLSDGFCPDCETYSSLDTKGSEMTDEIELNKYLHELVGLCRHEWRKSLYQYTWQCSKCGLTSDELPLQFHFLTWEGFGIAWEWIQRHERWSEFLDYCMAQVYHSWDCIPIDTHTILPLPENIVSPRALAEAIVEFFKEDG